MNIPVLRKDFTVDEYMIYQAKAFGASAVLLICAILDNVQLKAFGELAQDLGLDIRILYQNRVDAVLIGENLMRSPDKKAALEELNKDIV